jgi:hypothetical protein
MNATAELIEAIAKLKNVKSVEIENGELKKIEFFASNERVTLPIVREVIREVERVPAWPIPIRPTYPPYWWSNTSPTFTIGDVQSYNQSPPAPAALLTSLTPMLQ